MDAPQESWDEQHRHETPTQQLDRNWADLLQEFRVTQTGVQVLTGFSLRCRSKQDSSSCRQSHRTST